MNRFLIPAVSCLAFLVLALRAFASDAPLAGPFAAELVRVIDGDSLRLRVTIWVDQEVEISVRLRGIDAPERRGRCALERQMAARATRALEALVEGRHLELIAVGNGKFAGRVIATLLADGEPVAETLLRAGLARPYQGGRRAGWCGRAGRAAIRTGNRSEE